MATILLVLKPIVFQFLVKGYLRGAQACLELGLKAGSMQRVRAINRVFRGFKGAARGRRGNVDSSGHIITLLVSSYLVVLTLPNPIALKQI